jgi:hypothetical protein
MYIWTYTYVYMKIWTCLYIHTNDLFPSISLILVSFSSIVLKHKLWLTTCLSKYASPQLNKNSDDCNDITIMMRMIIVIMMIIIMTAMVMMVIMTKIMMIIVIMMIMIVRVVVIYSKIVSTELQTKISS